MKSIPTCQPSLVDQLGSLTKVRYLELAKKSSVGSLSESGLYAFLLNELESKVVRCSAHLDR